MFMTTVKLMFSLKCWLVPNPIKDQNNRWQGCQGEERREVQATGESMDLLRNPRRANFMCFLMC